MIAIDVCRGMDDTNLSLGLLQSKGYIIIRIKPIIFRDGIYYMIEYDKEV